MFKRAFDDFAKSSSGGLEFIRETSDGADGDEGSELRLRFDGRTELIAHWPNQHDDDDGSVVWVECGSHETFAEQMNDFLQENVRFTFFLCFLSKRDLFSTILCWWELVQTRISFQEFLSNAQSIWNRVVSKKVRRLHRFRLQSSVLQSHVSQCRDHKGFFEPIAAEYSNHMPLLFGLSCINFCSVRTHQMIAKTKSLMMMLP